jgi:hypothetical protein
MKKWKGSENKRSCRNADWILSWRFLEGSKIIMDNDWITDMPSVIRTVYLQNISVDRHHHTILLAVQVLKVKNRNNETVFSNDSVMK